VTAALLGIIIAIGGTSGLFGAFLAEWLVRRFGFGRTFIGSAVVIGLAMLLIPLAHGSVAVCSAFLIAAQLGDLAWPVYTISARSLRQAVSRYDEGAAQRGGHVLQKYAAVHRRSMCAKRGAVGELICEGGASSSIAASAESKKSWSSPGIAFTIDSGFIGPAFGFMDTDAFEIVDTDPFQFRSVQRGFQRLLLERSRSTWKQQRVDRTRVYEDEHNITLKIEVPGIGSHRRILSPISEATLRPTM
jgi:hypothetical protein